MRIVIDTNVVASAIFFGGRPAELLRMVVQHELSAVATNEIVDEYQATINYLLNKYEDRPLQLSIVPIFSAMEIIPVTSKIEVCRDPDDNKFISCAIDGHCYYVVSGDKDLLSVEQYADIKIITVADFLKLIAEKK